MSVEFKWHDGYDYGPDHSTKPKHYVCVLTADGYQYLDFLQEWNSRQRFDDRLCNNRESKKFGKIDKWVPDDNNLVQKALYDYSQLYADELKEINNPLRKKPKIKTQKQLKAAYRRKLRQTIINSIKECKNGMHRP